MARVTGPLMSFDASGTVAGSIVFAKWRGRNYVRRHAVPANPRSQAQLAARAIVAFLAPRWAALTLTNRTTWDAGAEALRISSFNEYVRINARNWRDLLAPSMAFPAVRTLTVTTPSSVNLTSSGRQVFANVDIPNTTNLWGVVLCRSTATPMASSPAFAVAIATPVTPTTKFVDGPLAPGDYYYNALCFATDGKLGLEGPEDSVTVA